MENQRNIDNIIDYQNQIYYYNNCDLICSKPENMKTHVTEQHEQIESRTNSKEK